MAFVDIFIDKYDIMQIKVKMLSKTKTIFYIIYHVHSTHRGKCNGGPKSWWSH